MFMKQGQKRFKGGKLFLWSHIQHNSANIAIWLFFNTSLIFANNSVEFVIKFAIVGGRVIKLKPEFKKPKNCFRNEVLKVFEVSEFMK